MPTALVNPPVQRDLRELRDTMRAQREQAIETYRANLRADSLLTELRRIVDRTLVALLEINPLPSGAALAAVGGYGRGELYPYSDVDVLVLLRQPADAEDEARIGGLITALWDIGLEPGHSARTIEECMAEAARDITVETALLEARYLAGSHALMRRFETAMQGRLDKRAFFHDKLLEMQQRHTKYNYTPYALEPNCKESPGGLRDLQVILWMARAAGFGKTWAQIARAGLLTADEARHLRRAEQAFKRLRIELHLLTRRREDRLVFDVQPAMAKVYGFAAGGPRRPSEMLMQRYYWAAKLVTQLNTILVQNLEERLFSSPDQQAQPIDEDFCSRHERLDMYRDDAFERKPVLLLRAFLVMQQRPELKGMSARMLRAIWHARRLIDAQFRRNPVNRHLFLSILQQPRGIVHELRRMNDLSILPRYLPPFRRIVGQMQHDLFHAYTVDQHILMVVRNLRRFTMPEHAHEYPLCSQLMANFDQPWLLYAAALFHDIAKGRGGDHSVLGSAEARKFARAHGLGKEDAELLEFLVHEHLTLSSVAQKKDISDPRVVQEFAQSMGDIRHLTALYLLTVADIRGTSPKVWNAWKAKLLEDLFLKTQRTLGAGRPDPKAILENRKAEALGALRLAGLTEDAHEELWKQLDVAYFLRHEAPEIAWQTRHLYNKVNSAEPIVRARVALIGEGLQIVVYVHDQPDLFARICGYFDERHLSIQDARIHTTRHGWALDSFVVLAPGTPSEQRSLLSLVEHELTRSLADSRARDQAAGSPAVPLGPRQSRQSRMFPITPTVELRPDERGQSWILSVTASDRTGLLHALARTFAQHRINLKTAKVMTLGERVEDTFLIDGGALNNPRSQIQFEQDLLEALQ
ncbi:Bifunctional uridylyltransferase/uridylyl-removing enzyme [Pigmentiphaga humi]|uniref:Bifunctional uridylyltransferase/uridylyl-removing enzyme n=1 Tax=Pigmentiphaga humi TaxID=2478468 RepID=A0A3P4B9U1_9BURK|nr:[protein-PII] uridylyltransferase [Pigmentiphaga humi]VCU72296.1 Bifunctional uridylyltransferase/uridylyl-removing enzyme [Pigmentiphaga humi]